ncbi:SDR family NAD(P)-dependent oxidoreductase [Sphingobium sp. MI1205]|uniref:SDR family NAD(P)-dependent oxidoreductase n=1 Tax=Sphingobium sp. MI1205 TaxID=407020 RepID=UPI00078372AF|nr:SDR family NAD(P)-dependent oxidoreductase [Sphingobium sp. MI1205]
MTDAASATTYGAHSTTDDVLDGRDLSGMRIFVTGVSSGLGVETARVLVARGAEVVGAARDLAKARHATEIVRQSAAKAGSCELVELDLASMASVRACADAQLAAGKPFDLIIANAGVMMCPEGRTTDGFETQFGTNHLGHFLLVNRLAPLLRRGGRVVSLSSIAHRVADIDLDDPNFESTAYDPIIAYGQSKTANALFAVEFDRRHRDRGVRATSLHPGGIQTELGRYTDDVLRDRLIAALLATFPEGTRPLSLKTVEQGAATSVWAGIVAPAEEVAGRYCEDCHVAGAVHPQQDPGGVQSYALDPERAKALWAKSEELVGERF